MRRNDSLDLSLAHLFRRAGQAFLFDGATGALARLDEPAYAAWGRFLQAGGVAATDNASGGDHGSGGCEPPGYAKMAGAGMFRRPPYPAGPLPTPGLHSLCLNVAHACNLDCVYCFAAGGAYAGGTTGLMTVGTARAAIDFLLANATPGRALSIDFFGGEPLLAWDVVEETVSYASSRAETQGNRIRFSITTNATLVDSHRARFIARHMSSVIVSLDGRPGVHDAARPMLGGAAGSYRVSAAGARAISEALTSEPRPPGPDMPGGTDRIWVRGTYTRYNCDFWRDVEHLAAEGFSQISMEPVIAGADAPYALDHAQLPGIGESYDRVLDLCAAGKVRFFHFELNPDRPACAAKRFGGCGAGLGYVCVAPGGAVYPCHQFAGEGEFELLRLGLGGGPDGADEDGPAGSSGCRPPAPSYKADARLAGAHVGSKDNCRGCWAQLHCGGGCHYTAWRYGGSLHEPHRLGCELLRLRLEHALALTGLRAADAGR